MLSIFLQRTFKDGDSPTKEQLEKFTSTWKNHWSQYVIRFGDALGFAHVSTPLSMAEQCLDRGTEFAVALRDVLLTFVIFAAYVVATIGGSIWYCVSWMYKGFFWKIYGPVTSDLNVVEKAYMRSRGSGVWPSGASDSPSTDEN